MVKHDCMPSLSPLEISLLFRMFDDHVRLQLDSTARRSIPITYHLSTIISRCQHAINRQRQPSHSPPTQSTSPPMINLTFSTPLLTTTHHCTLVLTSPLHPSGYLGSCTGLSDGGVVVVVENDSNA
jgi:hypothetical protein